jgi:AraC-like DNA-binding protein
VKPILEYLPKATGESFVVKFFDYKYFPTPWHFHPEYEIVLVVESTGTKLIGNNISQFAPGDLLLIGSYLPHTYRNDDQYHKPESDLRAKSIVVHFGPDVFGQGFFSLPETLEIMNLLTQSKFGISVSGKTNEIVSGLLHKMTNVKGFERLSLLLNILHALSVSKELSYVNERSLIVYNETETNRMNSIQEFVVKNFHQEIHLQEVADMVCMTRNSFSRYFTQRTRKSFTAFINEVRLKHAAQQLIETSKAVIEISMESGFTNLSNFNRQFRLLYQTNPVSYRKSYQK